MDFETPDNAAQRKIIRGFFKTLARQIEEYYDGPFGSDSYWVVLELLDGTRNGRGRTANEIAKNTRLSRQTVLRRLDALYKGGLIIEAPNGVKGGTRYQLSDKAPEYMYPFRITMWHELSQISYKLRNAR